MERVTAEWGALWSALVQLGAGGCAPWARSSGVAPLLAPALAREEMRSNTEYSSLQGIKERGKRQRLWRLTPPTALFFLRATARRAQRVSRRSEERRCCCEWGGGQRTGACCTRAGSLRQPEAPCTPPRGPLSQPANSTAGEAWTMPHQAKASLGGGDHGKLSRRDTTQS